MWKWDELSDVVTMISSDSAMILVKNYTYLPICRYLMISPTKIVLISPGKGHAHRWDLLTSSKKFKGLIDKDGEDLWRSGILTSLGGFLKWRYPNSWMVKTKVVSSGTSYKNEWFRGTHGYPPILGNLRTVKYLFARSYLEWAMWSSQYLCMVSPPWECDLRKFFGSTKFGVIYFHLLSS